MTQLPLANPWRILSLMRLWILAMTLAACGGLPEASEPTESYPITGPDVTFSCSSEWCPTVQWAVERWNRATGWSAKVEKRGIPVVFTDDPADPAWGLCGGTDVLAYRGEDHVVGVERVVIPLYERPGTCWDLHRSLTHEMGHALCGRSNQLCHRGTGVMSAFSGNGNRIDDDSLDAVCERWGCSARTPEVRWIVYPARPDR